MIHGEAKNSNSQNQNVGGSHCFCLIIIIRVILAQEGEGGGEEDEEGGFDFDPPPTSTTFFEVDTFPSRPPPARPRPSRPSSPPSRCGIDAKTTSSAGAVTSGRRLMVQEQKSINKLFLVKITEIQIIQGN